ncbi:ribbon-helix-helix domain-containing protein [uncultured Clostridium sp.]|nr:ribbon-helix-helix domain-containing protein [uncultured Clostridium sp.]
MARKAINTTIEADLIKKIKLLAIEEDCNINDLIEEGLKLVLEKRDKK